MRVSLSGTVSTHRFANVFYLRITDDGTRIVNDLNSILTAIGTNFNTDVRPSLDGAMTLNQIKGVWITSVGNQLTNIVTVSYTGAGGSTLNDAAACYVIDWPITAYYRGGHPRSYWPGVLSSSITNGSALTAGIQTTLATAFGNWRNHINALTASHVSQVEMGTVSYQHADAWRTPPVFFPYTGVGIRPQLGTQRRRIKH